MELSTDLPESTEPTEPLLPQLVDRIKAYLTTFDPSSFEDADYDMISRLNYLCNN
jgi:hypothetical protein